MHLTTPAWLLPFLALFLSSFNPAQAHPSALTHIHEHKHSLGHRGIDYDNIDYNKLGVDWSKVDYSSQKKFKQEVEPQSQPQPQPQPVPAQANESGNGKAQENEEQEGKSDGKGKDSVPKQVAKVQTGNGGNSASSSGGEGGTYKGPKRGLAFNSASPPLSVFSGVGNLLTGWCFNWNSFPTDANANLGKGLADGLEYVPMMHSPIQVHIDNWAEKADAAIASNSKSGKTTYLMAFNEPDIVSQANLSPNTAVRDWHTYFERYQGKGNVKL